jgi:CheY-like chemotaxis protein
MDNARRQGRDMVLIADSNVERAQRLARACVDRGIDVEVATHGAQALEVALSSRPVAMVAQLGLPLIDGERLAEILHANPRSETLGVLYVADDDAELRDGSGQARVVPGHADPEMLVHFLEAMVHRRQDPPGEVEDEAGGIEGELAQLSLTELIDLFHVNRKNGRIALEHASGPRGEAGQVVLREGDVIDASTGVVRGEKALYRLLGWDRGHFWFHPDTGPYEATIERPTRALLREGRRQLDEWKRLVVDLPPEHARVGLRLSRASLPNVLHPLSQEVLLVLEMTDRVQEVIDRCAYPDYQVLRTLITMVRRGLLEVRHEAPSTDALSGAGFSPAFGPQLRERIQRIQRIVGAAGERAKVLVVPSNEAAIEGFRSWLARVPGAEVEVAQPPLPPVGPVGFLGVDGALGVEWIQAPPSDRFEAVWPLAVHGSIAVVFLHAGPLPDSIRGLEHAHERIRALPRGRTLHVLLQEKETSGTAAELCETLSLFDERTALEVPLGEEGPSVRAMGELLNRILV